VAAVLDYTRNPPLIAEWDATALRG